MTTIGNWGDIPFYTNNNINAASGTLPFNYIEKKRLSGFPRLQRGSDSLGRVSVTLNLDADSVSPIDVFYLFFNAARTSSRNNLVLGDLDLGLHVVTNIQWRIEDIQDTVITRMTLTIDFTANPVG